MATLKDLFSAQQITALKAVATSENPAEKYAPSLSDEEREGLYKFSAEHDAKLGVGFWKEVEALKRTGDNVIVCVSNKRVTVEHMGRNDIFARHIGMMLKRGTTMLFLSFGEEITWDNWTEVYNELSSRKSNYNGYDSEMSESEYNRIKTERKKEKEFYDLARPIRSKKGMRMRISFEEAKAQRVRAEKASYEARVETKAREILAVL